MFWAIVGALLFVFVGIPLIIALFTGSIAIIWMHWDVILILGIIIFAIVAIGSGAKNRRDWSSSKNTSLSEIQEESRNENMQYTNVFPESESTILDTSLQSGNGFTLEELVNMGAVPVDSENCTREFGITICDLGSASTLSTDTIGGYRNVYSDGYMLACVNMLTGEAYSNTVGYVYASPNPSYCVSDFGTMYVDPIINVVQYSGQITKNDFYSPYMINYLYDTCVWSYADGNGPVNYVEVLGNIGPRSGYGVSAFCRNGQGQVDIYTYQ